MDRNWLKSALLIKSRLKLWQTDWILIHRPSFFSTQHITLLLLRIVLLDIPGNGIFNFWALLSTSLFLWYSAIESLSMAYVITPIECDLELSVVEKGLISSGCYIGNEIIFATFNIFECYLKFPFLTFDVSVVFGSTGNVTYNFNGKK